VGGCNVPGVDDLPLFDPEAAARSDDRDAVLAEFRARNWIARSERGFEVFTYERCDQALRDPDWLHGIVDTAASVGMPPARQESQGRNLLTSEGETHAALRRAVQPWFTPRRTEQLRRQTRALAERLIDDLTAHGQGDFLSEVAARIPATVFCWMIGAPDEDAPQLAAWSQSGLKIFKGNPADLPEISAALRGQHRYVRSLVEMKRRDPGDDLVSHLLQAVDDGALAERDMASITTEILAASSDNTSHSATVSAWLMCRYPDQWRRLQADRSLVPGAVEEAMRYEPRIRCAKRFSAAEAELGGLSFPPATRLFLHVAAAHRDPAVYPDPDQFDVGRRLQRPQLNFGAGRHLCLGAGLARMEQQEILGAMLQAWGEVSLGDDPRLTFDDGLHVERLPIEVLPN